MAGWAVEAMATVVTVLKMAAAMEAAAEVAGAKAPAAQAVAATVLVIWATAVGVGMVPARAAGGHRGSNPCSCSRTVLATCRSHTSP